MAAIIDVKDMTLDQKIGQMILAGFPSDFCDEHLKELIEGYNIGNIILFSRNIGEKERLAELTARIHVNILAKTGIPAFLAIDQEGGMVTRIQQGATFFPGNMAFSAADTGETGREGELAGRELRALGINLNLAPVLDVNNNPRNPGIAVRSYGDDPVRVAEYGSAYIKGLQEEGVIATAKHFPGKGDTEVDAHLDLPCVPHSIERLERVELYPFMRAIESGIDAIMASHVLFPAIEPEKLPGTLSEKILTGLLRRKMGFEGLIITDCMEMKAISDYFGTINAAVMAVKAGADLLCISHTRELQTGSVKAIKEAVLNGEIPESRIDSAVERILKIKVKYGLFDNPYPDIEKVKKIVGCREHLEFARSVSEKSITLVKDDKKLVPVKDDEKIVTVSTEAVILTGVDEQLGRRRAFYEAVRDEMGGEAFLIPVNPDNSIIRDIAEKARNADKVIIGTYNALFNSGQAELVKEIMKVNANVIVVSLRTPYDIIMFKEVPAYLCAYEYTPLSVDSIIKVLKGQRKAEGKLPVRLGLQVE